MSREIQPDYETRFLFPPSLEDWVGADHPARFVREFVDALDLNELGLTEEQQNRRIDPTGRPHYAADLLLKIWLYGYMYRIRSSRGLERGCRDMLPLVWLAGTHTPDHNTLWRFWARYREVIRKVFVQSVRVGIEAKLVGMVLQALDGTKIRTAGSKKAEWHKADLEKLLERLERETKKLEQQIAEAGESGGAVDDRLPSELEKREQLQARIKESLEALQAAKRERMHPHDPDAQMMKNHGRIEFAYNAQAMVDQQSGLIVAADVTDEANDEHQLEPMLEQTEQNTERFAEITVADSGYHTAQGLSAAEEMGAPVLVAVKQKKTQVGPYHAMHFIYDEQTNSVLCPKGQTLVYEGTRKHKQKPHPLKAYRCQVSANCPVASQCSREKRGRVIEISPHHALVVRNRKHPNARALLLQRQIVVERIFAEIKETLGMRRWTVRTLEKVKTQWSMICTAMNLRRMLAAQVA
jgi:transposase